MRHRGRYANAGYTDATGYIEAMRAALGHRVKGQPGAATMCERCGRSARLGDGACATCDGPLCRRCDLGHRCGAHL